MPVDISYLQPYFDTLSQGVQVSQHLKAAAQQQRQFDTTNSIEERKQALAEQEHNEREQGSLADLLSSGVGELVPHDGMRPQAKIANDPNDAKSAMQMQLSQAPSATPAPTGYPATNWANPSPFQAQPDAQVQNSPALPGAPDAGMAPAQPGASAPVGSGVMARLDATLPAYGTTPSPQPAPVPYDPNRIVMRGGRRVYIKTPEEQNQQVIAAKEAQSRVGKVQVTPEMSALTGGLSPVGAWVDSEKLANDAKAYTLQKKVDKSGKGGTMNERSLPVIATQTAAAVIAKQNGVTLDPERDAYEQLTPELQLKALGLAKQSNSDQDMRDANLNARANTAALSTLAQAIGVDKKKEEDVKLKNAQEAGVQLNTAGKTVLSSTAPAMSQLDQLLSSFEVADPRNPGKQYKDSNNPLNMTLANLKYKMGMKDDDPLHQIGSDVGKLNLASIQAAMPFASKSRAVQWLNAIREHTPKPGDSPALLYKKMGTIERNILAMQSDAKRYQTVKTNTNPGRAVLAPEDAQRYYRLALAGRDPKTVANAPALATKMATEDGWLVPQTAP